MLFLEGEGKPKTISNIFLKSLSKFLSESHYNKKDYLFLSLSSNNIFLYILFDTLESQLRSLSLTSEKPRIDDGNI